MGWCKNCDIYYKKMSNREICNNCSEELYGTPPGVNNMMIQYYNAMEKKRKDHYFNEKFKIEATLMDLSATALLKKPELVIKLAETLGDTHPPWYSLLRAWYRQNKCNPKTLHKEKYPMKKFFELMKL
jgi:hypothetical protein